MYTNEGTFPLCHAINSPIIMHTFMITLCSHIEFHRKATVINCSELKNENIKKAIIVISVL